MNFKILPFSEEIKMYSNDFTKNLKSYLNPTNDIRNIRSTFLYVNMGLGGKYDVINAQVIYSRNVEYYLIKLQDNNLIRYAFGKYDQLNFQLAKIETSPLQPLFIFDFSLNHSREPYEAVFAEVNKKIHILSKVYGLTDKNIETLNLKYKVYKLEDADYTLIDFGNINKIKKFFKVLDEITEDLNFELEESRNILTINKQSLNSLAKRDTTSPYKYCMVCGSKLEKTFHTALFDLSLRFPARCEPCLEKIYALELYYGIHDEFSKSTTISHSELESKWEDLLEYNLKLMTDYEFFEPFLEGLYKVHANDDIIDMFSPLLNPVEKEEEQIETLRICSVCGDYYYSNDNSSSEDICPKCLEKQGTKRECIICGDYFELDENFSDSDICSNCKDKQYAIELLHDLTEYVKPGSGFTKDFLINKGLKPLDLDIIINNLTKYGLLTEDGGNLLMLETQHKLNEFIKTYSDNLPDDFILPKEDSFPKQTLFSQYLYEDELDKHFNLIEYQKYVEVKQDYKTGDWLLNYKNGGDVVSVMRFKTPFETKMAAIRYLDEHNIIEVVASENEDIFESGKKILICPVCGKEFLTKSMLSQKYCEDCNNKYSYSEKTVLIGIHKGTYTNQTAIEIKNLLDQDFSKTDIAKKLKLDNPSLINSILKFLLPLEDRIIEKPVDKEPVPVNEDTKLGRTCPICGKNFVLEGKFNNSRKYCDECNSKYDTFEKNVLIGINKEIYTKDMAIEIKHLLDSGMPKTKIISKFNLKNTSMINPILKFLLPDDVESENKQKDMGNIKNIKNCLICGKKFVQAKQVSGQKYCEECRQKYSLSEISVLVGIDNGQYTIETAKKVRKLQLSGLSNKKIAEELGISSPLITPILKFIPVNDEDLGDIRKIGTKIKNCVICDEEFIEPKNVNSQKYCQKCKDKYSPQERIVLSGVKNGIFNEKIAIKVNNLKNQGKNNKTISTSLNLPIGSINTLVDILLPNNNHKISEGIFYNKEIGKYFVYIKNIDRICVGLFESKNDALMEKNKFLGDNEFPIDINDESEGYTNDKLKIENILNKWFVYMGDKLLDVFDDKEDANNYCKFYNSLKPVNSHPTKQLFKKDDKDGLNIILKGIISDKDHLSLLTFISTFDCELNKISCDKIENGFYTVLLDFNLEKSNSINALVNLNALGWSWGCKNE